MMNLRDLRGRPLRNLRLSITDRCNLRCAYCMPEEEYAWLPRRDLLDFEEIEELVRAFASVGVNRLRLTGGEPLLRRDMTKLISALVRVDGIREVAMTTNGVLLGDFADELRRVGLHRLTISLDTLRPERFERLTRRDSHASVLRGIEQAVRVGFPLKLDTVLLRGVNDDEIIALLGFAEGIGAELRFIEYMDVGGATKWRWEQVVSRKEILERIGSVLGTVCALEDDSSAPAARFQLPSGQVFGIIASTTSPFCGRCDRSRLTADGMWYRCLYAASGTDLRAPLRNGTSREEIAALITGAWQARADQGAVDRLQVVGRGTPFERPRLEEDPHLEMHTRGG